MKTFELGTQKIPAIGFGTWKLTSTVCSDAVKMALDIGYRHIDTADIYDNHREVGIGINSTSVKRDEIFLTSKVWHTNLKKADVNDCAKRNLDELNTDYINLYLIHWPNRATNLQETIEALEELKQQNIIKEWGVSNFNQHHLQDCIVLGFKPANNQVEFHPSFYQRELKEFADKNNILLTAYSPLGQGIDLNLPIIVELSKKYSKSPAQIILNWINSKNIVVIPKATIFEPMKENFESIDFTIDDEDLKKIDSININKRLLEPEFSDFNY